MDINKQVEEATAKLQELLKKQREEYPQEPARVIPMDAVSFTANGVEYFLEQTLSIERYAEFQIQEKELGYGVTFKTLFEKLQKIYKALDKSQFASSAVQMNSILQGIAKLEERKPTVLKICALFLNTQNENRATINADMINRKISDWRAEGLDMAYFFTLAANSVRGFLEIYKNITQSIMPLEALQMEIEE